MFSFAWPGRVNQEIWYACYSGRHKNISKTHHIYKWGTKTHKNPMVRNLRNNMSQHLSQLWHCTKHALMCQIKCLTKLHRVVFTCSRNCYFCIQINWTLNISLNIEYECEILIFANSNCWINSLPPFWSRPAGNISNIFPVEILNWLSRTGEEQHPSLNAALDRRQQQHIGRLLPSSTS